MTENKELLTRWLPVSLEFDKERLMVQVEKVPDGGLKAGFLQQDLVDQDNRKLVPLDDIVGWAIGASIEPDLFIFHMSRTGSTLAAGMFRAVPGIEVVSEPLVINDALSLPGVDDEDRPDLLRVLIYWFGCALRGNGKIVFKLSSWVTMHMEVFRAVFPEARYLFLFRDPVEVLVSITYDPPPLYMRYWINRVVEADDKGSRLYGVWVNGLKNRLELDQKISFVEHAARILSEICGAALTNKEYLRFISYENINEKIPYIVEHDLNVSLSGCQFAIDSVARKDVKSVDQGKEFVPDRRLKTQQATPLTGEMANKYIQPLVDEMYRLEKGGAGG